MGIKITLTLAPTRRSARIAARAHARRARHTPYPARRPSSGSQPTPPPPQQPRAATPITKEEPRASSPIIKREESTSPPPPLTSIPFTPINTAAAAATALKRERQPKKEEGPQEEEGEEVEEKRNQDLTLHAIPQYFPALGPNDPTRSGDPRYIPGNLVIDEEGVERRVLGRGEVATLSTMECWENGDLF